MPEKGKIKSLRELARLLESLDHKVKKVVLCHGVFDLLHIGHIRCLNQARSLGDILVVTITPDRVAVNGPRAPAFNQEVRAEAVASLHFVDYVAVNEGPSVEDTLRLLRPDIYFKDFESSHQGRDSDSTWEREERALREIGAELAYARDVDFFSSTDLINRFSSNFPEEVEEYMEVFRDRYGVDEIFDLLDRMASLSVLVTGDSIIDDYHYCHSIGAASKDPIMAVQYDSHDLFPGGVLAVANHVSNFAGSVRMVTVIGSKDSHEEFIRAGLNKNIDPFFIEREGAPTTLKRRFLDGYSMNKMFEMYNMDDSFLPDEQDRRLNDFLRKEIPKYDLVVSADFGHGAISERSRNTLISNAPFLAVNTQANAGNRGFHTVSRYTRADFVSLSEHEARLEMRDLKGDVKPMLHAIGSRLGCEYMVVTCGKKGSYVRSRNGELIEIPALAQGAVDRIGAGDAFFSVTSMAAYLKASPELIGFIGNVVGALAVEIVGNARPVGKKEVKEFISALLM